MTTLQNKNLSPEQIVSILSDAGLSGLSQSEILLDPMKGLSGKTNITDDELKKLQASLAVYGILKIIDGSTTLKSLSPTQLANSQELKQIATQMVGAIKNSLNSTLLSTIKTNLGQYSTYIPDVTTDVIIKTAVTLMDRIVSAGYDKCNQTDGNITLALQEAQNVATTVLDSNYTLKIGEYYYGMENKNKLSSVVSYLPSNIVQGIQNTTGILKIDKNNNLITKDEAEVINLYGLVNLNAQDLGDGTITIEAIDSLITHIAITNEQNQTSKYEFNNNFVDIDPNNISNGKNKLSMIYENGLEKYIYIYKGIYNSKEDNNSIDGNTNYFFSNIKADGNEAKDMFVSVENYNDINTTLDDRWITILPDSNGSIAILNLNGSGGYRIDGAPLYEQYIVANDNFDNGGQDINTTSQIYVRKFNSSNLISGTLKKLDANGEVPFSSSDASSNNIWIHAHYTNTNATYSSVCNGTECNSSITSSGSVFVGAQDMHIENAKLQDSASYDFAHGNYTIGHLANSTGYKLLVFWQSAGITLSLDENTTSGNDIVLSALTKDINGTINDDNTTVRIARKVMFSGQPNIIYSNSVDKNSSNNFSINYSYDTSKTTTYILWGTSSNLTLPTDCNTTTMCKEIKVGGDNDNSTNISIP